MIFVAFFFGFWRADYYQTIVGSTVWAFRRLKKPKSREISAHNCALHSQFFQLFFVGERFFSDYLSLTLQNLSYFEGRENQAGLAHKGKVLLFLSFFIKKLSMKRKDTELALRNVDFEMLARIFLPISRRLGKHEWKSRPLVRELWKKLQV